MRSVYKTLLVILVLHKLNSQVLMAIQEAWAYIIPTFNLTAIRRVQEGLDNSSHQLEQAHPDRGCSQEEQVGHRNPGELR